MRTSKEMATRDLRPGAGDTRTHTASRLGVTDSSCIVVRHPHPHHDLSALSWLSPFMLPWASDGFSQGQEGTITLLFIQT